MSQLSMYAKVAGADVIAHLEQLARPLKGMKVVHVSSTYVGGGVAEILTKVIPLSQELGLDTEWLVIDGSEPFFQCTKLLHNALQGSATRPSEQLLEVYRETNRTNAERLREHLQRADVVIIHDPQPAPLLQHFPERKGKWVWRCHIDASRPFRPVWRFMEPILAGYDASVFSLASFAQKLPHPQYLITPSIDPLSDKNRELEPQEIAAVLAQHQIDPERPLLAQISRFDRFKDPVGVLQAYQLAKEAIPALQLVLAGGGAGDDPEGMATFDEVMRAAAGDPDVKVLLLPADAHRTINALQRAAALVLQKSLREGFGLTVTEGLWKKKPVIGGDVGGIRLQVINHHTGFLVSSPEGAALRIRYLLRQPEKLAEMGTKGRALVRDNFLITRHMREYLTLIVALHDTLRERIVLS